MADSHEEEAGDKVKGGEVDKTTCTINNDKH